MKVFVIGLDCADPRLVFEKFKDVTPNLRRLWENGIHGEMRTIIPPITIPAWMCMATGKDPGTLGLYGFRHRKGNSYGDIWIANSTKIKEPTVWDIAGKHGRRTILVGFPPTYPPRPIHGLMVTDFITPDINSRWTWPPHLKKEIMNLVGEYRFDVVFRTDEKDAVLRELYDMTEKRFRVIKHLLKKKWDLFWFVEIGVDRIHHAFWKYMDPEHHLYEPGNPYESAIEDYYRYLDARIGEVLDMLDDDTAVIVVSDHGAKRMKGCFLINEWLIREGYLKLKRYPESVSELKPEDVDWDNTVAWGWGGYYARVFLNVRGREERGVVDPEDYESVREEIAEKLRRVRGPNGEEWKTQVLKPKEVYPVVRGDPPDLMVFFDDLYWRSAGTVGWNTLYLRENDKGPDDAVHDWNGIFILHNPQNPVRRRVKIDIRDVAPTILDLLGVPVPEDMQGGVVKWKE